MKHRFSRFEVFQARGLISVPVRYHVDMMLFQLLRWVVLLQKPEYWMWRKVWITVLSSVLSLIAGSLYSHFFLPPYPMVGPNAEGPFLWATLLGMVLYPTMVLIVLILPVEALVRVVGEFIRMPFWVYAVLHSVYALFVSVMLTRFWSSADWDIYPYHSPTLVFCALIVLAISLPLERQVLTQSGTLRI